MTIDRDKLSLDIAKTIIGFAIGYADPNRWERIPELKRNCLINAARARIDEAFPIESTDAIVDDQRREGFVRNIERFAVESVKTPENSAVTLRPTNDNERIVRLERIVEAQRRMLCMVEAAFSSLVHRGTEELHGDVIQLGYRLDDVEAATRGDKT